MSRSVGIRTSAGYIPLFPDLAGTSFRTRNLCVILLDIGEESSALVRNII